MTKAVRWLWIVVVGVASAASAAASFRDAPGARPTQERASEPTRQHVATAFADLELSPWEASGNGTLIMRLAVAPHPGIHIYAPGQRGYYPLSLTFSAQSGVKAGRLELPSAETYVFEPTGERFLVYRQPFTAIQHATLVPGAAAARSGRIPVTLRYQACDDRVCFKPEVVSLVWTRGRAATERPGAKP